MQLPTTDSVHLPSLGAPSVSRSAFRDDALRPLTAVAAEPPPQTERSKKVEDAMDPKALADAVQRLNEHVKSRNSALQFEVDDVTGYTVIRVIDRANNDELIRQIPAEEVLSIARHLRENVGESAVILDTTA